MKAREKIKQYQKKIADINTQLTRKPHDATLLSKKFEYNILIRIYEIWLDYDRKG